ncbi:family 20 glycosylhydrolase [Nonomuraea sp. NPDC050790]|uniref:family 20 glycosylhydrolase n=1 Tax=Nonomuraea sp. NPDC050790 TaxID=3364371 RepID=UPI0037B94393
MPRTPRILTALLLAAGILTLTQQPAAAAAPPRTIPAPQQWSAASGTYTPTAATRVVYGTGSLRTTAEQLAADLYSLTGLNPPVVSGTAADGDIALESGSHGAEGYRMTIGARLTIAGDGPGVFYGTQTLLQMVRQQRTLPRGVVTDAPRYRDRGFMVDVARQFYSVSWLRARIRELAYLKYNQLHLHLSDNEGFRLQSQRHPGIVSAQHYTKQQITDLVAYAARHHITIVPEIDLPGHAQQITTGRPGLALRPAPGWISLDLSQQAAWDLADDLIEEYLPLFPGKIWHLGADEWLSNAQLAQYPALAGAARERTGHAGATGRDLQYAFINHINGKVRAAGKTLRIWNDQLVENTLVKVEPTVQIEHWWGADDPTPQEFTDRGHTLINANWNRLYYIVGHGRPNPATLYESFAVNQFALGEGDTTIGAANPRQGGAELSLWGEPGLHEPENSIATNLRPTFRAFAQQTWGSPKPVSAYTAFTSIIEAVGDAPSGAPPSGTVTAASSMGAYQSYGVANMIDANPSTLYWSDQAATAGAWVGVDLGAAQPISRVTVRMADTAHPSDYLQQASLEVSADGTSWAPLGSCTGQREINLTTQRTARLVRLRATASQAEWVIVREFTVS